MKSFLWDLYAPYVDYDEMSSGICNAYCRTSYQSKKNWYKSLLHKNERALQANKKIQKFFSRNMSRAKSLITTSFYLGKMIMRDKVQNHNFWCQPDSRVPSVRNMGYCSNLHMVRAIEATENVYLKTVLARSARHISMSLALLKVNLVLIEYYYYYYYFFVFSFYIILVTRFV